jgi:hypothetical protein
MQGPTLTPAQLPSNDADVVAGSLRRGGWLARLAGRLVSSPPEIDLWVLPILPPALPACANASPIDGIDIAAAINAIATQVKARIDNLNFAMPKPWPGAKAAKRRLLTSPMTCQVDAGQSATRRGNLQGQFRICRQCLLSSDLPDMSSNFEKSANDAQHLTVTLHGVEPRFLV